MGGICFNGIFYLYLMVCVCVCPHMHKCKVPMSYIAGLKKMPICICNRKKKNMLKPVLVFEQAKTLFVSLPKMFSPTKLLIMQVLLSTFFSPSIEILLVFQNSSMSVCFLLQTFR